MCAAGSIPQQAWPVLYLPSICGGSPACSCFVFSGATHVFLLSELVGLSILTKSCYISYLYLNAIYREDNNLISIYFSVFAVDTLILECIISINT